MHPDVEVILLGKDERAAGMAKEQGFAASFTGREMSPGQTTTTIRSRERRPWGA